MAYTFVQGNASGGFGAVTARGVTLTSTVGVGNTILGMVTYASTDSITSITDDKSNTYTIIDTDTNTPDGSKQTSFWLLNITNSPQTITANFSIASVSTQIVVDEFSGVSASAVIDAHAITVQTSPGTGTDGVSSGSIVTSSNGDLIWAAVVDQHSTSPTISAGTGFTTGTNAAPFLKSVSEYQTQSTAGSIAATFTTTVNEAMMVCVVAVGVTDSLQSQIWM